MAEVSRFSVSKQFRRRPCDTSSANPSAVHRSSMDRRGMARLMSLGLIQSLVSMSIECGITHWCATMEPTLLRLLAAMSIRFEPLGPSVQHHGARQPCYCEVGSMLERVKNEQKPLWDVLTCGGVLRVRRPRANPWPGPVSVEGMVCRLHIPHREAARLPVPA
jgi:N-acyl amino acid synthase of PEP-CTERM/exosortase system